MSSMDRGEVERIVGEIKKQFHSGVADQLAGKLGMERHHVVDAVNTELFDSGYASKAVSAFMAGQEADIGQSTDKFVSAVNVRSKVERDPPIIIKFIAGRDEPRDPKIIIGLWPTSPGGPQMNLLEGT